MSTQLSPERKVQIEALQHASRLRRSRRFKRNIPLLIMFIPGILFYLIFKYAPMGGLIIAFKDYNFYDGILKSPWVGMDNFTNLFKMPETVHIIRNTLVLSGLTVFLGFPFPIALAILLNEVKHTGFKKSVQTIVYMPHFFSWVIMGGIIVTIFSVQNGTVNHWIMKWTGEPYPFLYQAKSWITLFVSSGIWKEVGFNAIIYLAALTSIDPSLYESSSIDGASKWQQIWHITLPGIATTIVLLFILSLGKVMEVGFDHVYTLQNAMVSNVSEVISTYIYKVGLQGGHFSLTAAMGLFEAMVGLILVVSANSIARKFNQSLW